MKSRPGPGFHRSLVFRREFEQAIWRLPEKFAPIRRIWEQFTDQLHKWPIILPFLGPQVGPVRRPHAMIESERIDERPDERPAILEWISQPGEFQVAGKLYVYSSGTGQSKNSCKGRLTETRRGCWSPDMIDQDLDRNGRDPWLVHQELVIFDLQIQKHVEIGEPVHQAGSVLVILVAVKCRIDRDAYDPLRLQLLQRSGANIRIDDCDALEAPLAFRDRIEETGIVAFVSGIWLHQECMLHAETAHHPTELLRRADLLSGGLVGNVLAVRKLGRINHMCMAVNLRLVENMHRAM